MHFGCLCLKKDFKIIFVSNNFPELHTAKVIYKLHICKFLLSDFLSHHASKCSFTSSDSWVILSPIEQSIKQKIEAVGTPLRDWDIQINYGIKTGCNEAFIISDDKRKEIIKACKDDDERKRTEELIRPIFVRNCTVSMPATGTIWKCNAATGPGGMARFILCVAR